MIVLGIDPGCIVTGFSIIHQDKNLLQLRDYGCLKFSSKKKLGERIAEFYDFFLEKIATHFIDVVVLETPFLGKNSQSFLKLGYLRGNILFFAHQKNLTVLEFAPTEIKQAVTGFGGAPKEQVARVVRQLFPRIGLTLDQHPLDVTDAIAIALCGIWRFPRSNS